MTRLITAVGALSLALALGGCSGSGDPPEQTYTMDEVAAHATAEDCWTVVNDYVYDLSGYPSAHPGGAETITAMCGRDATASFGSQHDGSRRAESILTEHIIGSLEG